MNNVDPVLTPKQVAEDLRCSKSQVYRLMNGDVGVTVLPHLTLGRKKVVPRSIPEEWKDANVDIEAHDRRRLERLCRLWS